MYSQCGEDDIILKIFGDYVGRFLDIGAHDGRYLSNTLALIERGWSGVMVEANPRTFARLVDNHGKNPKLTLVNAAIGLDWELTKFWPATKDDGLSTTEEDQRIRREAEGWFTEPYYVAMVPIDDEAFLNVVGIGVDFVSIDTEGTSPCLLSALPGIRPRVVCVEHDGKMIQCREWAQENGYRLVHENSINLIFERKP